MTNKPYGNATVDIKDHLKSVLVGTTSFANSTFFDRIATQNERSENPIVIVTLEEDSFSAEGPHTTLHNLLFHVEVAYLCEYTEASFDTMIGYVGEIVDAIEDDRGFSEPDITMMGMIDIDYTWEEAESIVIRKALIRVDIEAYRNI